MGVKEAKKCRKLTRAEMKHLQRAICENPIYEQMIDLILEKQTPTLESTEHPPVELVEKSDKSVTSSSPLFTGDTK